MKIKKLQIDRKNNKDIFSINLINDNNFEVCFYNYGGYIHNIFIPYKNDKNKREDVILGYKNLSEFYRETQYFNSIIGRVCNRIGSSKFILGSKEYNLYPNIKPHHLHGGKNGFNKKIWEIINIDERKNSIKCVLNYFSPHMEENYPGNLDCKVIYELNNNNELLINFKAISDSDTIVNLTNHNYWNFHGHGDYYSNNEGHIVSINSESICETDEESIPSGEILDVRNTKFNLINEILIDKKLLNSGGIDHNYILKNKSIKEPVAKIYSKKTRMGAEYFTDQKGIQFYTGNMMLNKYAGKYNKSYGLQYGICLEPQNFPDAINHFNFPSPILRKNKNYISKIKIKLRNDF